MIYSEEWPDTYEDQFRDYYTERIEQDETDDEDWMVD